MIHFLFVTLQPFEIIAKNLIMEEPLLSYKCMPPLLSEADLEGMAFNTPVPFYDTSVACGMPKDNGSVLPFMVLMPDEIIGPYDTYCTRAIGDSMEDLEICSGDLLVMETPPVYESRDIVLAEIDGEKTLKTYYVAENGEQWLVPANKKYHSIRLDGSKPVKFCGRLKQHLRRSPHDPLEHIVESIEQERKLMETGRVQSEDFRILAFSPECADRVISRLHVLMEGKFKPRDVLMPLRAAIEAGAIRRPTWAEFISEFGCKLASKASLSGYTDPTKDKYGDDPQFVAMVDDFRQIIRSR